MFIRWTRLKREQENYMYYKFVHIDRYKDRNKLNLISIIYWLDFWNIFVLYKITSILREID